MVPTLTFGRWSWATRFAEVKLVLEEPWIGDLIVPHVVCKFAVCCDKVETYVDP